MLIDDIEYVIFRHPDPAAGRAFMTDFGLLDLGAAGDTVYLRLLDRSGRLPRRALLRRRPRQPGHADPAPPLRPRHAAAVGAGLPRPVNLADPT